MFRSHSSCQCITDCCKSDLIIDHFLITCRLVLPYSTSIEKKSITYRNYRSLDYDFYASELKLILLSLPYSIDSLINALAYLIDKFSPLKTGTINIHSKSPWFSSELVSFKRNLHKLERIFHSNPSSSNFLIFSTYRKFYKSEISKAKFYFYISKINNITSIPPARKLLSPTNPINIPHIPNIANNELCYEFANHSTDKIQRTCTSISSFLPISSIPCTCISKPIPYYFSKFYMPSIFTISNLISKSSSSSDPINLAPFKNLNYTLSPYILDIIIISLNYGICPTFFKHTIITPILEQRLLDPNIIANYRPIHNFCFSEKYWNELFLYN